MVPDTHKRFNAFDREWDICEEFDPEARLEDEDESDYGDSPYAWLRAEDDGKELQMAPHRFTDKDPVCLRHEDAWRKDLFSVFGQGNSHGGRDTSTEYICPLEQILYE